MARKRTITTVLLLSAVPTATLAVAAVARSERAQAHEAAQAEAGPGAADRPAPNAGSEAPLPTTQTLVDAALVLRFGIAFRPQLAPPTRTSHQAAEHDVDHPEPAFVVGVLLLDVDEVGRHHLEALRKLKGSDCEVIVPTGEHEGPRAGSK